MDVPEAWIGAGPGAIASFPGGLGQDLVAVGVKLEGRLTGDLLLALPEPDAENLAAMLGFPPGSRWGGLAESALVESGNIVGSAFVTAVGTLVRETLLLSVLKDETGIIRLAHCPDVPREELARKLRRANFPTVESDPASPEVRDEARRLTAEIGAGDLPREPGPLPGERVLTGLPAAPGRTPGRAVFTGDPKKPEDLQ